MLRPEEVQAFQRKTPFEPFRVHLSDGTTYDVKHPELIMVGERSVVIGVPRSENGGTVYHRSETVALIHIVRLVPIGSPAAN
jgi:hypothetical protein